MALFDGNIKSQLMIIGEAPGKEEDEQGLPFVGSAGQLLNKMLSAIQLERKDIYITNAIPWKLPQNRTPTDQEILEFLPFLQRQIEIIKPKIIYLLGTTAAKAILSTPLSLDTLRAKWHDYNSINMDTSVKVLVSYHPSTLLQSPKLKKEAWVDLQMLQKELNEN
jgi:DNA polymerase